MSEDEDLDDPAFMARKMGVIPHERDLKPMEWQPIETFPDTSGDYLTFGGEGIHRCHAVRYWDDIHGNGWCYGSACASLPEYKRPTHWMPLPNPPEAEK